MTGMTEPTMPPNVVVLQPGADAPGRDEDEDGTRISHLAEQPAKVMRISTMIRRRLAEGRAAPPEEASRARLGKIHQRSVAELAGGLAPELRAELDRLSLPFTGETAPSDSELRIAQAQLVGWLEGLFH